MQMLFLFMTKLFNLILAMPISMHIREKPYFFSNAMERLSRHIINLVNSIQPIPGFSLSGEGNYSKTNILKKQKLFTSRLLNINLETLGRIPITSLFQ